MTRYIKESDMHKLAALPDRVSTIESSMEAIAQAAATYKASATGLTENLNAATTVEDLRSVVGFYFGHMHTAMLAIDAALSPEPETE